jgi:hypothetical protein
MTALDAFIQSAHGVVTVLTLCVANPGGDPTGRGCVTKWVAPGRHMVECRILTATVRANTGDRLQCAVLPMDRQRAAQLFTIHGVCARSEASAQVAGSAFPGARGHTVPFSGGVK